jgi:thioredoxin 1
MTRYVAAAALIGLLSAGCPEPVPHVPGVEVEVAEAMFQSEVLDSPLPVLVDFGATWCGPCRQMEPVLAQLSLDYEGRLKVVKIDVDESPSLASQYDVSGIPALVVFVDGEVVDRTVGSQSMRDLARFVEPYVAAAPAASAPVVEPAADGAVSEPNAG